MIGGARTFGWDKPWNWIRGHPRLEQTPLRAPLLARAAVPSTLTLTHSKQRANFCLVVGKGKTKTRPLHQFISFGHVWVGDRTEVGSDTSPCTGRTRGRYAQTLKTRDYKCTAESTVSQMLSENLKGKNGKKADQPSGNSALLSHKTLSFLRLERLSTMLRTICFYF